MQDETWRGRLPHRSPLATVLGGSMSAAAALAGPLSAISTSPAPAAPSALAPSAAAGVGAVGTSTCIPDARCAAAAAAITGAKSGLVRISSSVAAGGSYLWKFGGRQKRSRQQMGTCNSCRRGASRVNIVAPECPCNNRRMPIRRSR